MYSKIFNVSGFLCIILYLAPLISTLPSNVLKANYYEKSCPKLEEIVRSGVQQAYKNETRMVASLLRLQYQDCFVNGCDGSLLLDDMKNFIGEQTALPNAASIRGLQVIDNIKADVEKYCPRTVSCADILALVAREAVYLTGGPFWKVLYGRLDRRNASKDSVLEQLPSAFGPLEQITAKFAAKGLDINDMVVLSGAHTIGSAQCFMFRGRLRNFNKTGKPDPSINPSLLKTLKNLCKGDNDKKTACDLAPLDPQTPNKFDNKYYQNLMNNKGLLQSDQALMTSGTTAALVKDYSSNSQRFLKEFSEAMVKLGNVGVITKKGEGEIRTKCGCVN